MLSLLPALRSTVRVSTRSSLLSAVRPVVGVRWSSTEPSSRYQNIIVSNPNPAVTLITLNRPKALNALNSALFHELNHALEAQTKDANIGAVVLTGSSKAFAAGADIKEMKDKTFAEVYGNDFLSHWTQVSSFRKPIIAAVSGYALGGGCELAMMCDIILCSPSAQFGQPEINLGVIPGAGGTQRLTRALGKSRAMELVLTGALLSADEAVARGLASRVVGGEDGAVVEEAVKVAAAIAGKGRLAALAGKEAVNAAYEVGLRDGLVLEKRLFHQLFATGDQKEGMAAFAEKRKAKWTNS